MKIMSSLVEIIAAQMSITVGRQYFEYAVAQLQDGYIESTAAQVVDQDLVLILHPCQDRKPKLPPSGSLMILLTSRPAILPASLVSLLLAVGEVSRNSDNGFRYFFTQIGFRIILQLRQNHRGNILRCVRSFRRSPLCDLCPYIS